jgi:hypothetical protein
MVFLYKAQGTGQKITALVMTVVDLLGEGALFTFDTIYQTGASGMIEAMPAEEIRLVVLGLSGLIFLNILATVVFHLLEPENLKNMRKASVRDRLEDEALKLIEKRGEEIAQPTFRTPPLAFSVIILGRVMGQERAFWAII